jgi:ectoine hydroxylase-related dioxygenase (phytanoyl-CoA dioxygenase family)
MDAGPSAEAIEKAAHDFRVHGALAIQNVFPVELIRALQEVFSSEYESLPEAEIGKRCLRVGDRRHMFTVSLQGPFNDPALYASKRLQPIVQAILGDDCVIQSFGAVCAFPGAEKQHFHKDHPPMFPEASGLNALLPPFALHVVIPMVNLDEQNGTTALWLGSHREKSKEALYLPKNTGPDGLKGASLHYPQMGDCYLMDFRLSHCGMANQSGRPRTILYLVYSRSWFQDHENFSKQARLDISQAEYEKIPEQHCGLFANARPR